MDDRQDFERQRKDCSLQLGEDRELFAKSVDLITHADQYRYSYLWSWLGVPIIQMPADVLAMQEVIWQTKPDVVVETGVARGGSVIFSASLLSLIGKGKVIGVDIDIRPHNRDTIEKHPQASRITLIQGSSIAPETVDRVKAEIPAGATVMVVLDSDHSHDHVLAELRAYASMVSVGHYLVCADTVLGFMEREQTPVARSKVLYRGNEPLSALATFLAEDRRFEADAEINGKLIVASSPGGYVRRLRA
ncbi:MAG TPA: CmcI family methyltransferase [Vicinamibacterales bacterium]|nr:CmcI family methyltransferase [Vicinamibacterales bacterium]